jgi:hypothetical protein
MTIRVTVLSAANLSRSPTDPLICPTVAVWAYGPGRVRIGESPESLFRHPENSNPLWHIHLDVDWFRVSYLEFVISHFRAIVANQVVAIIGIPLLQIPLGTPYTVPVTYTKPDQEPAEFTFQVDLIPRPPPSPIQPKWAHKRLYVYATYDPPIELAPTLPVTFGCVNSTDIEQRFSVFDEFVHWQSIGKASLGLISFGPTGPTHVVHLNRGKCDKSTSAFLVTSHSYAGTVTLNFLLAEDAAGTSPEHSLPRNESQGFLLQSSVQVTPGTVTCLPHSIRIVGRDYRVGVLASLVLPPGGDYAGFIGQISRLLSPDIVVRRRLLLPFALPFSISDAAALAGLPPPHRITIVSSFMPAAISGAGGSMQYYASVNLLAFDAAGQFVEQSGGALVSDDPRKYGTDPGFLRRPYYWDEQCVAVDLDALLAAGVCSLAVTMVPPHGWRLARFRRKAIRIVETDTKTEIGVHHVVSSWLDKEGLVVGGIVFANDCWSWVPAGEVVKNQSGSDFRSWWYQTLLHFRGEAPK